MGLPDFSHDVPEHINVVSEEIACSIGEIDGEKVGGACYVRSAISHRVISLNIGLIKR